MSAWTTISCVSWSAFLHITLLAYMKLWSMIQVHHYPRILLPKLLLRQQHQIQYFSNTPLPIQPSFHNTFHQYLSSLINLPTRTTNLWIIFSIANVTATVNNHAPVCYTVLEAPCYVSANMHTFRVAISSSNHVTMPSANAIPQVITHDQFLVHLLILIR